MAYREVKPNQTPAWDFEEKPEVEGTLINVRTEVGPNKSMMYELRQEDGTKVSVWGSTGLDNVMSEIETGKKIKIVFEGMKPAKRPGQTFKSFKVYVDERE